MIEKDTQWSTWGMLMFLSLAMPATKILSMPKTISVLLILGIMLVMAGLIAFRYMHLREEKPSWVAILVGSTIFIVIVLLGLTVWDADSILKLSRP
jgi:cytochrome c oxidase subunit IV